MEREEIDNGITNLFYPQLRTKTSPWMNANQTDQKLVSQGNCYPAGPPSNVSIEQKFRDRRHGSSSVGARPSPAAPIEFNQFFDREGLEPPSSQRFEK
jgi:hypothetical protein